MCFFWRRSCLHWVEGSLCGTRNRTGIAPCLTFGSICHALVFVSWHRTPEIEQLQGALPQMLAMQRSCSIMSCGLGLCWHQTQPEIGQRQRALSELLACKGVVPSLLPWSLLAPALNQKSDNFNACPFQSCLNVKALLHHVSAFGLCWHRTQPEIGQLQRALSRAATCKGVDPSVHALVFVGTGLNQKSDNFNVPFLSCYK